MNAKSTRNEHTVVELLSSKQYQHLEHSTRSWIEMKPYSVKFFLTILKWFVTLWKVEKKLYLHNFKNCIGDVKQTSNQPICLKEFSIVKICCFFPIIIKWDISLEKISPWESCRLCKRIISHSTTLQLSLLLQPQYFLV